MHSPELVPSGTATAPTGPALRDRKGNRYEPAIGTRLKYLLAFIFVGVGILGATGVYLFALSALQWFRKADYTTSFSLWMTLAHIAIGVVMVLPFIFFGFYHLSTAYKRPNRRAVRLGIALFTMGLLATFSGLALLQLHDKIQLPTGTKGRAIAYLLHVFTPVIAVVLYVLHRRAGPDLKWQWGAAWGGGVVIFVGAMCVMHSFNPHEWNAARSVEGEAYFVPSAARTDSGNFMNADTLMMDQYCKKCHEDIFNDHFHSAHKHSSFNNKPYLLSVRETRKVSLERDGNMKGARWCAGCHDVVPFFSGKFDDPKYDDVNDPTSQAGITCTACHAITHINSTDGNGDYTIEEPQHYPFAKSENPFLQWVNNQMVKAKPDFHKQTFMKPLHRSTEFCSTCHKVSLPVELNHYKDFLRGQNHHDAFTQSGFGGQIARSFYYPPVAKNRCADCHMPLEPSNDFGTRDFDNTGIRKRHDHRFPGANTGLPSLLTLDPRKQDSVEGFRKMVDYQAEFLKDKKLRIDLFGVRKGDTIDGEMIAAPFRPKLPKLQPGQTYLIEVVVRTLAVGHAFSQGTVDSNEIWVDFEAKSGDKVFAKNGGLTGPDDTGAVDEYAHFINVLMLDRNGNRINRRNPQDIFTPLYNHQIPPGAANVVHYRLEVPTDIKDPVEIKVRVRYRKFDFEYMALVHEGADKVPKLPIVDMCADSITLPIEGGRDVPEQTSPIDPPWQRWNDYGIGMFLAASGSDSKPGVLQAEQAFTALTKLDAKPARMHGYLNLARSYILEGGLERLNNAKEALNAIPKLEMDEKDVPWWTVAWFSGVVEAQNGNLDQAIQQFEKILDPKHQPKERNFDFTKDYVILDEAGRMLFKRSQQEVDEADRPQRYKLLLRAIGHLERTLTLDREDVDAHYLLNQCYGVLGADAPPIKAEGPAPIDGEELKGLAKEFADTKVSADRRLDAAGQISRGILELGKQAPKPGVPRPAITKALLESVTPVFQTEPDARLKSAAAQVLANVHQIAHGLYKPDETAANTTVNIYRGNHKAAAAASQAIIIYPTNRLHPQDAAKKD
jgi:tetratricopeptide (TPR) repeat protein